MKSRVFLLVNMALAFYNVGTIWAHEVDIFRSWKLLEGEAFRKVQAKHWKKLLYWVFIPVGLALLGSFGLIKFHPAGIAPWEPWLAFGSQLLSLALTAGFWGRWQAKLSEDERGGASPYLALIVKTHWIRTGLINLYGLLLLAMCLQTFK
jgi:hypothetical protein